MALLLFFYLAPKCRCFLHWLCASNTCNTTFISKWITLYVYWSGKDRSSSD